MKETYYLVLLLLLEEPSRTVEMKPGVWDSDSDAECAVLLHPPFRTMLQNTTGGTLT